MNYGPFLENYKIFSSGNETPELCHIWCAISTLAGAVEKRLWIDRDYFRIYLNLYILLIGPPGVIAKSTSMGLGLKMLKETGYNVLEDSVLKERIIEEMCAFEKDFVSPDGEPFRHASMTFVADELNSLLASGVDMVKFLVAMFNKDETYFYKTKNSGVYEINYPHFNLVAAAVDKWFGAAIANDMTATGFLARCITVYEDKKRGKFPHPKLKPHQEAARSKCIDALFAISQLYGKINMTDEADKFYNVWYEKQDISPAEDYRMAGYLERRTKVHVLKVAALLAASALRMAIGIDDIKRSIAIFAETEKKMRLAFLVAGANKLAVFIPRILAIVNENDGVVPLRDVVAAVHTDLDPDQFKSVLKTMESMEMVASKSVEGKTHLIAWRKVK